MQDNLVIDILETKKRLRATVADSGLELLASALGENAKLYLVGGIVRDTLLGKISADIDVATNIGATECFSRLSNNGIKVFAPGLKHDTVTAIPIDGKPAIEITSFRNGAKNIEGDLDARDFTVNAIAYDIQRDELIDPLNGKTDLEKGIIRTCGDAYIRFTEDPLRVLRMVRFSSCLNFTIDNNTHATAKDFLAKNNILTVSIERIRDEFSKILTSARPVEGIRMLAELGILKTILPEVNAFIGYEQNDYHKYDLYNHTLEVIRNTLKFSSSSEEQQSILILRLAALLHDVGKPASLSVDNTGRRHFYCHEVNGISIAKNILKRFKYPNEVRQAVSVLIRTHMRPINGGDGSLRRIIRDTGDYYKEWRQLKEADSLGCKLEEGDTMKTLADFDARIALIRQEQLASQFRLALNGKDIIALGFKEGPQVGKIIQKLTDLVLDNPQLNTKEELIRIIEKKMY